ncbi:MAG TPA: hypothetical protein ENI64_00670 [Gammaproteobacteria bacterium]|nr:hypothetical protein [Gammaproteobacteria bacterium]
MTEKNLDDLQANADKASGDADSLSSERVQKKRRKLLKGAVSAAPVILTVASRPVWARNCSLSGQLSGNLSDQTEDCAGEGCTPGYWRNHPASWHPSIQDYLLFDVVFGTNVFPNFTLGQVISLCSNTTINRANINIPVTCTPQSACLNLIIQLGYHAVAAIQNAATEVKYDLTVEEVIAEVQATYAGGDKNEIETQKNRFDMLNNQGCPGGGGPACGNRFTLI